MTIRTCGAAFVAALLLLSASGRAPAVAADPVELNVVISQTGQGAFIGSELKESMQLATDVANKAGGIGGRPLKLNFFDDQTNPQVAVQLFGQLAAKHVPVIVGPSFTAPCLAAAATVQAAGPVLLCSSPAMHPAHGSFAFSMTPGIVDDLAVYVRFFRLHGWNRIGLITSADATGQDVERQLSAILSAPENKNMKVVESDRFELGALDTTAQFSRLKAANCDAIIAWTTGAPWGTLVHGIDNVGLNVPIVTSPGNMVNAQNGIAREHSTEATLLRRPQRHGAERVASGAGRRRAKGVLQRDRRCEGAPRLRQPNLMGHDDDRDRRVAASWSRCDRGSDEELYSRPARLARR